MTYSSALRGNEQDPQEYGQIVASDGWSYQLTPNDILWLARSVDFEGGTNPAAVIWTYAQRLALPHVHSSYPTLASLVRAHSQPVNPKWARDGEFCRPGGRYAGKPECSEAKLARRDRAQSIPWEGIDPYVRDLVMKFSRAQLSNPVPRSVEFAQGDADRGDTKTGYLGRNPAAQVLLKAGNWFIGTAQSLLWPKEHVRVQYRGLWSDEEGSASGLVWLALIGAGIAGILVWRKAQRR